VRPQKGWSAPLRTSSQRAESADGKYLSSGATVSKIVENDWVVTLENAEFG
jgi:hypothetical protein